jgi:hypothetical protein
MDVKNSYNYYYVLRFVIQKIKIKMIIKNINIKLKYMKIIITNRYHCC